MDIGRALGFAFRDAAWIKKILIGGLISLIPIIGGFVGYGYALEITRRVALGIGDELPEWDDFGGYLARGFIYAMGLLLWLLPVSLVIVCVTLVLIAATSGSDSQTVEALVGLTLLGVFSLAILAWAVIVLPIVTGRYVVEQRFGAMFEIGQIMTEIRRVGVKAVLLLLVIYLIAGFVGQLGIILCFIGVIFTSFYAYLVIAHGAGQIYRRAMGINMTSAVEEVSPS